MSKSLWIAFTVAAGFTGFHLGYSVPPMIEINADDSIGAVTIEKLSPMENEEISDYYKELQEIK